MAFPAPRSTPGEESSGEFYSPRNFVSPLSSGGKEPGHTGPVDMSAFVRLDEGLLLNSAAGPGAGGGAGGGLDDDTTMTMDLEIDHEGTITRMVPRLSQLVESDDDDGDGDVSTAFFAFRGEGGGGRGGGGGGGRGGLHAASSSHLP
eukprot:jgi/Mesen1/989/ME000120S00152